MSKPVRVPDPVYERLQRESDERDIPPMAIVGEWMDKADRLDEIQDDFLDEMQTRGGADE